MKVYNKPDVSIIDYGINNLKSISKAFEKLGKTYSFVTSIEDVNNANCLILPGVGAFSDGMKGLQEKGLIEPIKEKVKNGTPLLGICLGMQMLFTESEEFGVNYGLNLISGRVVPFKRPNEVNMKGYKVPHVAWTNIRVPSFVKNKDHWKNTLLENIKQNVDVYFVHSYYARVDNPKEVIATSEHGNQEFCAVVGKNNVVGTQFHPEKSGAVGLKILQQFCILYDI